MFLLTVENLAGVEQLLLRPAGCLQKLYLVGIRLRQVFFHKPQCKKRSLLLKCRDNQTYWYFVHMVSHPLRWRLGKLLTSLRLELFPTEKDLEMSLPQSWDWRLLPC